MAGRGKNKRLGGARPGSKGVGERAGSKGVGARAGGRKGARRPGPDSGRAAPDWPEALRRGAPPAYGLSLLITIGAVLAAAKAYGLGPGFGLMVFTFLFFGGCALVLTGVFGSLLRAFGSSEAAG